MLYANVELAGRSLMPEGRIIRGDSGGPFKAPGHDFKASGHDTEGRFDFLVVEVEFLTGPPLHIHAVQEDTFYVLEGVMTVQLGDRIAELGPGDFASAPPGVPHTFTNADAKQKTVRAVNVMTPGIGFDRFIEQFVALQKRGAGTAEVERLSQEYGVQFVGPPISAKLGLS
jgi:quercetin dioxygenase-like cupin family protein